MTVSEIVTGEAVICTPPLSDGKAPEHHATQRLQLLDAVMVALGRAKTSGEVADVMTTVALQGIGAKGGGLCLLTGDNGVLETLRLVGVPPSGMSLQERFPLDMPTPVCDAIRLHEPIVLPSVEAGRQRYPHPGNLSWLEQQESVVTLPLLLDENAIGAIMFTFSAARAFDAEEIRFLRMLAALCARALERTRLLEEQDARIAENSRLYQQAQAELKQRQAVQAALRAERERLGAIIAEMPAGVMLLSAEGDLLLANREAARIYDVPDLMAMPKDEFAAWRVLRPDGSLLQREEYMVVRSLTTGETVRNEECSLQRRDGTRVPLLVNSAPLRDAGGEVMACILTFSDITPLKEIEAALRASEALYRTLGESGPDYVWSTDAAGTPNYVSRAWAEYTRGPAEKIGEIGKSFLHPSHYAHFVRTWEQAKANGSPFEAEFLYRRHDGVYHWFMARAVPVRDEQGTIMCWVGTTTNIHEHKMAEAALEQSEERSRSLVEVLTALVWTTDGAGAFVTPQVAWERYTGQSWAEHRGFGWKRMLHPDDRERICAAWEQTVRDRSTYRVTGRLCEWVGCVDDVDDVKQREEQILALNARLRLGIRETHHRVKNNLQIVGAMLDMSLMDAVDALPLADARRVANQVQMLAKVHDILTAEARFDRFGEDISSRLVLERLLPMLQTTSGIHLTADIADIPLTVHQATSLALVVNELASNAGKHGRGLVGVVFTVSEGQGILRVRDNGDGFPTGFDWRTAANTGLMIVEQVVRHDLGGTLRFGNRTDQQGAEVCVTMPLRAKQFAELRPS
jgi:PAS domain S-box-containing protein